MYPFVAANQRVGELVLCSFSSISLKVHRAVLPQTYTKTSRLCNKCVNIFIDWRSMQI